MRIYVLYFLIVALAIYAWRDWFISLCGLIVLSALMGHPDMPRFIMGIQGLNPWNLMLVAVMVPWLLKRRHEGLRWDLPRWGTGLLVCYVAIIVIAYVRAAFDLDSFPKVGGGRSGPVTLAGLTSDRLINSIKYLIPGMMLYDGCRTRRRVVLGLVASLMMAVLYSVVILRTLPLSSLATTGPQELKQRRHITKRVGFHANSVAMICVTGFWGSLACSGMRRRKWHLLPVAAAVLLTGLALLLTRSRAGYVAFLGIGLLYAVFLWRSLILLLPVFVISIVAAFPGVSERMLMGVGSAEVPGQGQHDIDTITAGRTTNIWPSVIAQIWESPLIGHGRLGILRTPAHDMIVESEGACPEHPHNAYLEMLLDSGLVGLAPVVIMYGILAFVSAGLCLDRRDPMFGAAGVAGLAAVGTLAIMSMSGSSLFPRENSQMAWCLYGVTLRVWVERRKLAGRSTMTRTTPRPVLP